LARRTLIWIRTLHEEMDLGSVAAAARARWSVESWREHQEEIRRHWERIREDLAGLCLDLDQTKLYHDSLALEGQAARKMVEDLAAEGSANYTLVLEMMRKGAVLVRTEDPALLMEEYNLIRSGGADPKRSLKLLTLRDEYVAGRIAATLNPCETGVLFLGAAHNVRPYLPPDVHVVEVPAARP
ncbi:MAG: hypothetical protein Q8P50_17625, partial [Bacillota bacterium]|nr:hypothetical protein [Bacillota bacterium]